VIFLRGFRVVVGWITPVIIVSNIPARLLIKPLGQAGVLRSHLMIAGLGVSCNLARFEALRAPSLLQHQLLKLGLPRPDRTPGFCG
jgi:hypothetical protein